MIEQISELLRSRGLDESSVVWISQCIAISAIIILSIVANFIAKSVILRGVKAIVKKSKYKWDDKFLDRNVFGRLSHIAPALVIYLLTPMALASASGGDAEGGLTSTLIDYIERGSMIYMLVMAVLALDSFFNAVIDIYRTFDISKHIPIKSFIQVAKLILYFLGVILAIALVVGQSPLKLIAGLGAMTAVLMLVFKDPIMGFVAGIQLTTNKMVARGDWIEMPKFGVDGDVEEVALTTVKVRNFDKTVSTIPTYALISDSFKNWRGMSESGGRRIKRAIHLDISSIKFCDEEMLERFAKIQHITGYLDKKRKEVSEHNEQNQVDNAALANGRRLTNVGTFRAYIEAYLRNQEMITQELTFLVRQLKPTETGLPIEIYVFCKDKRWVPYEAIQADIFDHLLAVAPEFDLRVFQNPTGADFRNLVK
jgi:miniconductance mechanosensitive channel